MEEMEIFQATAESELHEIYESQRIEYRDFVTKVYEEIHVQEMERKSDSDTQPDVTPTKSDDSDESQLVVKKAMKKLTRMPSSDLLHIHKFNGLFLSASLQNSPPPSVLDRISSFNEPPPNPEFSRLL